MENFDLDLAKWQLCVAQVYICMHVCSRKPNNAMQKNGHIHTYVCVGVCMYTFVLQMATNYGGKH